MGSGCGLIESARGLIEREEGGAVSASSALILSA